MDKPLVTRPGAPRADWTIVGHWSKTDQRANLPDPAFVRVAHSPAVLADIIVGWSGHGPFEVLEGMPADHECEGLCGGIPGGKAPEA